MLYVIKKIFTYSFFIFLTFSFSCYHDVIASDSDVNSKTKKKQKSSEKSKNYISHIIQYDSIDTLDTNLKNTIQDALNNVKNRISKKDFYFQLNYWQNNVVDLLKQILKSQGYYDGDIDIIIEQEQKKDRTEYIITFLFSVGKLYHVNDIKIVPKYLYHNEEKINIPTIDILDVKIGDVAIAYDVLLEEKKIKDFMDKNNCLLNFNVKHEISINYIERKISVYYVIEIGPVAHIKNINFQGLSNTKDKYLDKVLKKYKNTCFQGKKLEEISNKLNKLNLFAYIIPVIPEKTNEDETIDLKFKLSERANKSFKLGLYSDTELGLGLNIGWENRNFTGNGDLLGLDLFLNRQETKADVKYIRPFFMSDKQKLVTKAGRNYIDTKALISRKTFTSFAIERDINDDLIIGYGSAYTHSVVSKNRDAGRFSLFSVPLYFEHDLRDDRLNPYNGRFVRGSVAPTLNTKSRKESFVKGDVLFSTYLPLSKDIKKIENYEANILAFKIHMGGIVGKKINSIPPSERFYLGGMSSLRGYGYHAACILDDDGKPLGGKFMLSTSVEFRTRLSENVGGVLFFDGGNNYLKLEDIKSRKLLYGFGFGVLWLNNIAPIRFDIGFPLKSRAINRKNLELYIGIGHNF